MSPELRRQLRDAYIARTLAELRLLAAETSARLTAGCLPLPGPASSRRAWLARVLPPSAPSERAAGCDGQDPGMIRKDD